MPAKEYTFTNKTQNNFWLLKSEPSTFSIEDLQQSKHQTTGWEGVRNYQARNFLRDEIKKGDLAFFYHSSCPQPAIVGIVEITHSGYPDTTAFDPKSDYYDPKSSPANPRWFRVDVTLKEKFSPITLSALKANPKLAGMRLLKPGNRLSVLPVTSSEWKAILAMK